MNEKYSVIYADPPWKYEVYSKKYLHTALPNPPPFQKPADTNGWGVTLPPIRNRYFGCFYHVSATFVLHDVAHRKTYFC